MTDNIMQMSKKRWYKWSFYINIVLFFIIIISISSLVIHSYNAGVIAETSRSPHAVSQAWIYIAIDLGFLLVSLAFIFVQSFRNLMKIIRRSL